VKAIRIHEFGDESVLRYEEVPDPQPGPQEVLVRVKAASLNRGDLGRRAGTYGGGEGEPLPFTPGWEVAGVVEAVGPEVRERMPGQRVLAQSPAGGYAELGFVSEATRYHGWLWQAKEGGGA